MTWKGQIRRRKTHRTVCHINRGTTTEKANILSYEHLSSSSFCTVLLIVYNELPGAELETSVSFLHLYFSAQLMLLPSFWSHLLPPTHGQQKKLQLYLLSCARTLTPLVSAEHGICIICLKCVDIKIHYSMTYLNHRLHKRLSPMSAVVPLRPWWFPDAHVTGNG